MSCAKRLNRSRCPLVADSRGFKEPLGSDTPHKGALFKFWGDMCRPAITCLRMNALRIVRLPPRANVPAQRTRRTNAFAPRGVTRRRYGLLPNYFRHLTIIIIIIIIAFYTNIRRRKLRNRNVVCYWSLRTLTNFDGVLRATTTVLLNLRTQNITTSMAGAFSAYVFSCRSRIEFSSVCPG